MPVIITRYSDNSITDARISGISELTGLLSGGREHISVLLPDAGMLHSAVRAAADSDVTVELVVPEGNAPADRYPELSRAISDRLTAPELYAPRPDLPDIAEEAPVSAVPKRTRPSLFFGRANRAEKTARRSEEPADLCASALPRDLGEALDCIDESFTQMLLRKIDERGMTDAQCYKKANVDRKLFSKIRSDIHYHPKKTTAIAFAIALELDLRETQEMLRKAGFTLSRSSRSDIIVEYYIEKGIYDVFEINEALFAFDQSLIG